MPTKGTKQHQKVNRLVEGKKILHNLTILLEEILIIAKEEALHRSRNLKKLPTKIQLSIDGVNMVDSLLDEALRSDGVLRLAKDLLISSIADDNQKRITEQ